MDRHDRHSSAGRRRLRDMLCLLASLLGAAAAGAQAQSLFSPDQAPRFLSMTADSTQAPVIVDPSSVDVFRRRIALHLDGVSRVDALKALSRASGIQFVYANDVITGTDSVRLQADDITVVAALTEILLGTGVDVAVGSGTNAILVAKRDVDRALRRKLGAPQVVHGAVRGDISGSGLPGVVVMLLDSTFADIAHAITDTGGEFTLRAPSSGVFRLRARRIGFRYAEMILRITGRTEVALSMSEIPIALPTRTTKERGQCRVNADSTSEAWKLWDNAELAMLNASITMREEHYRFDAEYQDRTYDMQPATLREMELQDSTIRGGRPWKSLTPDSLQQVGYATETATDMTLYAPDLDVLLSRGFLDHHCFAVHRGAATDTSLVGLDFSPKYARGHVDIHGTFWLDRRSAGVTSLVYSYTGFPSSTGDSLAGGRIDFTRLPSGSWLLSAWHIRAPVPPDLYLDYMARSVRRGVSDDPRPVDSGDQYFRAVTFHSIGGNVVSVRRDDGWADSTIVWQAPLGALQATVTMESPAGPVVAPGALVRIDSSRHHTVADSAGVARLEGLVAGDYLVEVTTPMQDALQVEPTVVTVTIKPSATARINVRVLSGEQAMRAACGSLNGSLGVITGSVTRNRVAQGNVVVFVRSDVDTLYPPITVKTSADGRFRICKVRTNEGLTVSAVDEGRVEARAHVTLDGGRRGKPVELVLPPKPEYPR